MSYTKREIIQAAFNEIGLAGYVYDLQPEDYIVALLRLNTMLGMWNVKGVRLSYPLNATNLDEDSNIPDMGLEAVITNLALILAPSYGKAVPMETKANAKRSYEAIASHFAHPIDRSKLIPRERIGAGDKPWRGVRTTGGTSLTVGSDNTLDF